jgi:hypothetical protein
MDREERKQNMKLKLRTHLLGPAMAGALLAAFASTASATIVTLNPSNAVPPLSVNGPFGTDNATIQDSALIVINTATGAFSEIGNFNVTSWNCCGATEVPVLGTGINSAYQVYGTFTASGTGALAAGNYLGTVTSLNVSLQASSVPVAAVFTVPANITSTGLTAGTTNHQTLGSATIVGTGTAAALTIGVGTTSTVLTSTEFFTAASAENGKFFVNPTPFNIDLFDSATATTSETTPFACNSDGTANAAGTFQCIAISGGGGNLTFAAIPEPASLALLGIGLLAMGAVGRRRARKA